MGLPAYLRRRADQEILDALLDTRVVVVNGARQVGKSTLVHALSRHRQDVRERRLDQPSELAAARDDPVSFVKHDGLLVIDEIQRAPGLILAIKDSVDTDPRPGRFILTGSARLLGMRDIPDSLVGRSETIELWPFSQGELASANETWIDQVFETHPNFSQPTSTLERSDYIDRATTGGYPEANRRIGRRRSKFFASYTQDLLDRDVTELAEIQRRAELHRLIRLVADAMAQPIVINRLSNTLGIANATVERYLALFEEVFLIKRLPPWSAAATTRTSRSQKLMFVDSGLGAHLAGWTPARIQKEPGLAGSLLENFVLTQIARQLTWSETSAWLGHYRTRDKVEVDGVLESNDGRVVGIEVKARATVKSEDFRGLRHLNDKIKHRFHHGFVTYTGNDVLSFGPNLTAIPIQCLWTN